MEAGGLRSCRIDSTSTDTFTYDQANRLKTATVAGIAETSTYDGDGIRFSRQVGAGPVIRAVTDPTASLPVTIDDGSRKYVWGLGLAYAVSGSAIEVQHADRLGSIRAVSDGTGAVIASYRTDEFGIPTTTTGASGSPFRYTGEPLDASGLTYLRARHYDPSLGRFMSRDPFAGFATSPLSLNRYSDVENNPATWSDPSGHCGVDIVPDVLFIGFDLLTLAFGPSEDRAFNGVALGADVGAAFIPCATGAGILVRLAKAATNWANPATLASHFARHGAAFGARTADEYAGMARDFFVRSQRERLPTKIDPRDGTIRVFDPDTNTFGAF